MLLFSTELLVEVGIVLVKVIVVSPGWPAPVLSHIEHILVLNELHEGSAFVIGQVKRHGAPDVPLCLS